jgi:hypothetical protein
VSDTINDFFAILEEHNPNFDEDRLHGMVMAFRDGVGTGGIREAMYSWLGDHAKMDSLRMRARETSTHYVWPLYLAGNGCGVAINEFKDPADMVEGYATTYHNHRYSFVSLILCGGYTQVRSDIELLNPAEVRQIRDLAVDSVTEGDVLMIRHQEFHRLHSIGRRTVTLVVKCPTAKSVSFSVDGGTLRVTRHVPVEERIPQLMAALVLEG